MDIVKTPEQIEHLRELMIKHRLRYKPKTARRGFNLSDEYIISYIKKYKDFYEIKHSKYFSYEKNFDFNLSSFKMYKPKQELEMTDRLKNEVSTGYVSFLCVRLFR